MLSGRLPYLPSVMAAGRHAGLMWRPEMNYPVINGLTFNQWLEQASVPHSIHLSDRERYWCYWLAGHKPEDHTPRHIKIERAAKAYIEAHDAPYTTGVSHDDYLIRCSDARAALRKALSE